MSWAWIRNAVIWVGMGVVVGLIPIGLVAFMFIRAYPPSPFPQNECFNTIELFRTDQGSWIIRFGHERLLHFDIPRSEDSVNASLRWVSFAETPGSAVVVGQVIRGRWSWDYWFVAEGCGDAWEYEYFAEETEYELYLDVLDVQDVVAANKHVF